MCLGVAELATWRCLSWTISTELQKPGKSLFATLSLRVLNMVNMKNLGDCKVLISVSENHTRATEGCRCCADSCHGGIFAVWLQMSSEACNCCLGLANLAPWLFAQCTACLVCYFDFFLMQVKQFSTAPSGNRGSMLWTEGSTVDMDGAFGFGCVVSVSRKRCMHNYDLLLSMMQFYYSRDAFC